ncbi:ATP-binding protein [Campylobacter lari]|uniref:ATPase, AAA family n=1 Tax=Campylobacter lari (strain RM2100 / D67 / ATCC BAA-1060) TaxID=306263 RepID=B9KE59_CAMLR|nr:ATP-binding protein [Campylobacter lari]ACM64847.2 ATPase, AAA family [Campylobacter lari RM2100]EAH6292273.1 ATP-binding protein [Campylobacter lari]EAI7870385.1 ATP-binding protein [Campylobacter lari]EAI8653449.1 ATP-binding protein [Campylobacter lari]EAJ0325949.1 ATP-binding protein [Campylobacter lari]
MKDLKLFLNDTFKSNIYKNLQCNEDEILILKHLCKNYLQANTSINAYNLLSEVFKNDEYEYLDHLKDLKNLIEKGFIIQIFSDFKASKNSSLLLNLLQCELSLSEVFLQVLENKTIQDYMQDQIYEDHIAYLKDEFFKIDLYQRLRFFAKSSQSKNIKKDITTFEAYIKERLKKSKISNVLAEIFKEYALNDKECLIFISLLKEEYLLNTENSYSRDCNFLLHLISENDMQKEENKVLLEEDSKLLSSNLLEYDEFVNSLGDVTKIFYLSDDILQRIINFKEPKKNKKIKLQNLVKSQDIFELIEPNINIDDVIMPESTKVLLESILKQQDKKVLERLNKWGIKTNKNIEAKIIFYGPAGTGKTMSALSMAKAMKKSILSFDCSKILSKYVGESEQNVRKIFDTYKELCQTSKQSPILLLNEADQFLSTRVESSGGADKMHNQMQNIFLEQIERFSGVIIATTNFLENLDVAFSRRFEYKIEFKKPNYEQRLMIWQKALPKNAKFDDSFDLKNLASHELSGAQIVMVVKNTALKAAISKDGIFKMSDFLHTIEKEIESSFDKNKIVGFKN